MKKSIEILTKCCEADHPSDSSYISIENDIIDGRLSHVIAAMDEKAQQQSLSFVEWVLSKENIHSDWNTPKEAYQEFIKQNK